MHGADKVSINSAAVKNPKLIKEAAKKFGSQCVVVAIDVKKEERNNKSNENKINKKYKENKYFVYINGGRDKTKLDAVSWAKKVQKLGARRNTFNKYG
jgi:cyclase